MSKNIYPKARKNNLVTSKVGNETVVYDTEAAKASCLNGLTAFVWESCDGKTDISSILETARTSGYQDASEQIILMAIEQLDKTRLLEESFEVDKKKITSIKRREVLQLLGARTATVLPVISTINIQPAIAQGSAGTISNGSKCEFSYQCISGCCNPNPTGPVCANSANCIYP